MGGGRAGGEEEEDLLQTQQITIKLYTIYKRQRHRHKKEQYNKEKERKEREWQPQLLSAAPIIHDQAVQLIFVHNDVLHPT